MRCLLGIFVAFFIQGIAPAADYTIATAAGSSWVGDNGPATSALLLQAEGVAGDFKGNLYIADAGDHRVRRMAPDGTITTFAGTGVRGFSGDGAAAVSAQLNAPYGLATDARGNVYIADLGNARVRRVTPDGVIATIAGGGALPAGGVNEGSSALMVALNAPRNIALDSVGNIYISDFGANRVYRLLRDGTLNTAAGTGVAGAAGDNTAATFSQLNAPTALAVDSLDALYIADSGNHLIRRVAGGVIRSYARAATPTGLAFDGLGTLYIADASAGQIVKVVPGGSLTAWNLIARDVTFASNGGLFASNGASVFRIAGSGVTSPAAGGGSPAHGDNGPAVQARLNRPSGVAMDAGGNLYIADHDNHRVRRVGADGIITTIAGTGQAGDAGDGGSGTLAALNGPSSVAFDSSGNVYIADTGNHRVRRVATDGRIFAASNGGLLTPVAAIPDSSGNVYIADADAGKIYKAGGNGLLTTVASGLKSPDGIAFDAGGNLYVAESGGPSMRRIAPDGTATAIAAGTWGIPRGVSVDAAGNLLVADSGLQELVSVDPLGNVTVLAGTGIAGFSGDAGASTAAQLGYPWAVATGPKGFIAIADLDNNRVRVLTPPAVAPVTVLTPPPAQTLPELVNAASLQPGPAAPSMLMLLRNTGLGAAQVADVQILFGQALARILSADSDGILILTPSDVAGTTSATLKLFYKDAAQFTIPVAIANASPALFADSSGEAMAANEDGSLNSAANPALQGSIISLYGTGLGVSNAQVGASIGSFDAEVLYAGPVNNYPGLSQFNVRVPAGYLPSGQLAIVVSAGASSSQSGISLFVQ